MTSPGHVEQALGDLVEQVGLPNGTKTWLIARGRAPTTFVHEFGHRLDGIHADGWSGQEWEAREDWSDGGRLYRSTYDKPFDNAKARDKQGRAMAVEMAHEPSEYNRYSWAGRWVNQYEARIYHGKKEAPTADMLAQKLGATGRALGPVEFIAMSNQYLQEAQQAMERTAERSNPAAALREAMGYKSIDQGRELYGVGWRNGLEGMYRAGERHARYLADTASLRFSTEAEVINYAALISHYFGTPLDVLIGQDGHLARYMEKPLDDKALAKVQKLMPEGSTPSHLAQPALRAMEEKLDRAYMAPARKP